jgi:HesB-like selenoprotein
METLNKELLTMSDSAYEEFLNFLRSNNVEQNNIRISLAGHACSGPRFGLLVDERKDGDMETKIKDLTFYVEAGLFNEFDGFQILSTEENMGQGMVLRPNLVPESAGCSSCDNC